MRLQKLEKGRKKERKTSSSNTLVHGCDRGRGGGRGLTRYSCTIINTVLETMAAEHSDFPHNHHALVTHPVPANGNINYNQITAITLSISTQLTCPLSSLELNSRSHIDIS